FGIISCEAFIRGRPVGRRQSDGKLDKTSVASAALEIRRYNVRSSDLGATSRATQTTSPYLSSSLPSLWGGRHKRPHEQRWLGALRRVEGPRTGQAPMLSSLWRARAA